MKNTPLAFVIIAIGLLAPALLQGLLGIHYLLLAPFSFIFVMFGLYKFCVIGAHTSIEVTK